MRSQNERVASWYTGVQSRLWGRKEHKNHSSYVPGLLFLFQLITQIVPVTHLSRGLAEFPEWGGTLSGSDLGVFRGFHPSKVYKVTLCLLGDSIFCSRLILTKLAISWCTLTGYPGTGLMFSWEKWVGNKLCSPVSTGGAFFFQNLYPLWVLFTKTFNHEVVHFIHWDSYRYEDQPGSIGDHLEWRSIPERDTMSIELGSGWHEVRPDFFILCNHINLSRWKCLSPQTIVWHPMVTIQPLQKYSHSQTPGLQMLLPLMAGLKPKEKDSLSGLPLMVFPLGITRIWCMGLKESVYVNYPHYPFL